MLDEDFLLQFLHLYSWPSFNQSHLLNDDVKESVILCLLRCLYLEKQEKFGRNFTPHLSFTQYQDYHSRDVPTGEDLEDGLMCILVISDLAAKLGNPCLLRLIWDNSFSLGYTMGISACEK